MSVELNAGDPPPSPNGATAFHRRPAPATSACWGRSSTSGRAAPRATAPSGRSSTPGGGPLPAHGGPACTPGFVSSQGTGTEGCPTQVNVQFFLSAFACVEIGLQDFVQLETKFELVRLRHRHFLRDHRFSYHLCSPSSEFKKKRRVV